MGNSVFPLTYRLQYYNLVASGAAIDLLTTSPTTFGRFATSGLALALYGSGVGGTGALDNFGGNNTYAGPITLANPVTIGSNSTAGGDQLSLTGGINTQDNSLTIAGPGNTIITTTAVSGGGTLIKTGYGTLTLDFTGSGSPTSNLVASSTALTVGGGTFAVNGITSGGSSQTFASLAVNSGATAITNTSNGSSSTLTFTSNTITHRRRHSRFHAARLGCDRLLDGAVAYRRNSGRLGDSQRRQLGHAERQQSGCLRRRDAGQFKYDALQRNELRHHWIVHRQQLVGRE